MAYVPELDDPKSASSNEDSSDISAQSNTSNIAQPTAAPSSGGQSVGAPAAAAPGPSSSGNFQDFSKFKAANQNKLSALSNLATDTAKNKVNDSASAFNNAGAAYQQNVNAKKVDFNSGTKNEDGSYNVDAYTKKLQDSANKVDTGDVQGQLVGTKEYSDLNAAEQAASGINSRAGTAAILGQAQTGASAAAANQDSLLLQSMGDYRTKANEVAQGVKGTTANALSTQQADIRKAGEQVNAANASGRQKALDALKAERTGVDTDLATRAAKAESDRVAAANSAVTGKQSSVTNEAQAILSNKLTNALKEPPPAAPPKATTAGMFNGQNAANQKKYEADMAAWQGRQAEAKRLSVMTPEQQLIDQGITPALDQSNTQYMNDVNSSKITADTLYRDDAGTQSRIAALDQLLNAGGVESGQSYNAKVLDPVQSQALSSTDQLIAQLQESLNGKLGNYQPITSRNIKLDGTSNNPNNVAATKTPEQIRAEEVAKLNAKLRRF